MNLDKYSDVPFEARAQHAGFRLKWWDIFILLSGLLVSLGVYVYLHSFYLSVVFVFWLVSNFLFCNVFRVRQSLEQGYYVVFALTTVPVVISLSFFETQESFDILTKYCLLLHVICTIIIISINFRLRGYHGVRWQKINPTLDGYIPGAIIKFLKAQEKRESII